MNEMTVEEFCDLHRACADGRDWAVKNCTSMEDAWGKLKPDWLLWVATRKGVLTDRELRKFAIWSARQVQHLMKDPRSLKALDVAERYANGQATDEELRAAWAAAEAAAWSAAEFGATWAAAEAAAEDAEYARYAARCAAWAAAWAARNAARDDVWGAARDAAWGAAWAAADAAADAARDAARAAADAARDAARAAAWGAADAARDAALGAQAAWLRKNTRPNFGRSK